MNATDYTHVRILEDNANYTDEKRGATCKILSVSMDGKEVCVTDSNDVRKGTGPWVFGYPARDNSYEFVRLLSLDDGGIEERAILPGAIWQTDGKPSDVNLAEATASERKRVPLFTGCIDYFPDALAAIAAVSLAGNEQHNPGEPLHWSREKSNDHADCVGRHMVQRGTIDNDGHRHTAKAAWRILAILQLEIEDGRGS